MMVTANGPMEWHTCRSDHIRKQNKTTNKTRKPTNNGYRIRNKNDLTLWKTIRILCIQKHVIFKTLEPLIYIPHHQPSAIRCPPFVQRNDMHKEPYAKLKWRRIYCFLISLYRDKIQMDFLFFPFLQAFCYFLAFLHSVGSLMLIIIVISVQKLTSKNTEYKVSSTQAYISWFGFIIRYHNCVRLFTA